MAGTPIKREKRAKAQKLMKDESFWDHIFEQIAEGVNLPVLAAGAQIPYRTLHENITKDPVRQSKYEQARHAQAAWQEQQINKIADRVESGIIEPQAAKVSLDARKWLASRQNPTVYGERTQHDVKIQSIHTLHLEAHADLAQRMKQIPDQGETIDHEDEGGESLFSRNSAGTRSNKGEKIKVSGTNEEQGIDEAL